MLHLWLVLMTLAALALAVQVPAVDNDDWHVDGQRAVLPVEGCTQFKSALLLYPGSAAMYRFNGTSVAVLGAVYEEGAEALIELEGQQRRVNAQSRQRKCAEFVKFDNLNAGVLHTIRISVSGGQDGGRRAVFPLIALDITPPTGSGQLPPGQPSSGPKPPDPPPNPAPPADPTTNPLPTRPVTPIPSPTESDEDENNDEDKPAPTSTRKPDSSIPTQTPDDTNSDEDVKGQDSTLTEQSPSSSVDGADQPPLTVDSDTFTASNDSPSPSNSADSSLDDTDASGSSTSGSSGPKAGTLVPAVLIPILILLALSAFAIWLVRRRRRNRLPPSAEWRMANPKYEAGWGYGSSEQMGEVVQPWAPPAPSGYGADGRPWSPFQDDGRRY